MTTAALMTLNTSSISQLVIDCYGLIIRDAHPDRLCVDYIRSGGNNGERIRKMRRKIERE